MGDYTLMESICKRCGCVLIASTEVAMNARKLVHEQDHSRVDKLALVVSDGDFASRLSSFDINFLKSVRVACS